MTYSWMQDTVLEDQGVCKKDFKSWFFTYIYIKRMYYIRKYAYYEWKITEPS